MTDLNNKLNLNNMHTASYPHTFKAEEDAKSIPQVDKETPKVNLEGTKAAESYGRVLVKKADKFENTEAVESVKNSIDFFLQNPELAAAAVKTSDDAYELLSAQGTQNAYEKACCGACDALEARM